MAGSVAFVQLAAIPPVHRTPVAEPPNDPPMGSEGCPSHVEFKAGPAFTVGPLGIVTDKLVSAGIVLHPLESSTFKTYVIGLEVPFGVPEPLVGVAFEMAPAAGATSSENEVASPSTVHI